MKRFIFTLTGIAILATCGSAFATRPQDINCSAANTRCAASCSNTDMQASITSALATGLTDVTVSIPACDISWQSGQYITIPTGSSKNLRLIGSGESTTKIKYFQIYNPSMYANLIEWGHMTAYADNIVTYSVISHRLRAYTPNVKELYFHDLSILDYNTNYNLHVEGWYGLMTRMTIRAVDKPSNQNPYGITVHGNGQYSQHKNDVGTRNALFIEDSKFYLCSHSVSLFCNAFVVFRHNEVHDADAYLDLHGPEYNGCAGDYPGNKSPNNMHGGGGYEIYNNKFYNVSHDGAVSARTGTVGIVTNNEVYVTATYTPKAMVLMQHDGSRSGATGVGSVNCGTGAGQTCARKYVYDNTSGCRELPENWFVWNNTPSPYYTQQSPWRYGEEVNKDNYCTQAGCGCVVQNEEYFNRAPTVQADGFAWTPYSYPHPLAGGATPPAAAPSYPGIRGVTPPL